MPAKNAAQLRAAYAAKQRGEAWGAEMVAKTPKAKQSRMLKGTKPTGKKPKKSKLGKKKARKRVREKK